MCPVRCVTYLLGRSLNINHACDKYSKLNGANVLQITICCMDTHLIRYWGKSKFFNYNNKITSFRTMVALMLRTLGMVNS